MPAPLVTLRVFVGPLAACTRTPHWPHDSASSLLSDNLIHLQQFASLLDIPQFAMRWSPVCVPYFDLTAYQRVRALINGASEVTFPEAEKLAAFWAARDNAMLDRLRHPPLYTPPEGN